MGGFKSTQGGQKVTHQVWVIIVSDTDRISKIHNKTICCTYGSSTLATGNKLLPVWTMLYIHYLCIRLWHL